MEHIKGFFSPTVEPQTLEVCSPIYYHTQHWDPVRRRSTACLRPERCPGCELGQKSQVLALVAVLPNDQAELELLRFPRANTNLVRHLASLGSQIVGMLLAVERDPRPAQTGPIVANVGRVPPRSFPVEKYIAAIGRRAAQELRTHLLEGDARAR